MSGLQDTLDSVEGFDARVIQCLQDYREELQEQECRDQVHVLTKRASQDIRFDEPLADACYEDRARLCDGVQPVNYLFERRKCPSGSATEVTADLLHILICCRARPGSSVACKSSARS